MISALQIRNFKCWADTNKLQMRPLTFLVGPNSSGKSSIIQSLLLLRQTVESRDQKNPLSINGPYVQLGSYPDVLFMHDYKARLNFEIEFSLSTPVFLRSGLRRFTQSDLEPAFNKINLGVEFGYNKKTMQVFPYGAFRTACRRAGIFVKDHELTRPPTFHDFRRTFATEMRRAGVAEGVIMDMAGWKTRSIFERYFIKDESDQQEALRKRKEAAISTSLNKDERSQAVPQKSVVVESRN